MTGASFGRFGRAIRVRRPDSRSPDVPVQARLLGRLVARPAQTSGSERPAIGPDPVATHGSAGMAPDSLPEYLHRSRGPQPPKLMASQPPLSIGCWRTGQSSTVVASMRRNRVDEAAATRRQGCVNFPATLRQLLVNCAARVPGAGRATGAAPVTDSFDRSAMRREALRCKGYRGAGNSASTLGQLCVNR